MQMIIVRVFRWLLGISLQTVLLTAVAAEEAPKWRAGAASVDITPEFPVRLSGYGSRTQEHEGISMRLHAKALALAWEKDAPVVILTVDNCGVPESLRAEVLARVVKSGQPLENARFALHSSHTHCAPMLPGMLPFLFGQPLTADETVNVERYASELKAKLTEVVTTALKNLEPARLDWSRGKVRFAMNRRLKTDQGFINSPNLYGPTDHELPVLRVRDAEGKLRAIFTSYACHCTTLAINQTHPDWAGCAQKELELRFPDIVAMTAIGCGADQNPVPRREIQFANQHGVHLAKEVVRLINAPMTPLSGPVKCATQEVMLPFDSLPDRATWQSLAQNKNKTIARHAQHFLAMLDQQQKIPPALPYTVQVWAMGQDLLTINLPGEVVVDYGLRFKKTYGLTRTWVNGYTNDVPCYIPSQRVWEEGGYEAAGAMVYYGRPTRFATGIEEIIARAVHSIVPAAFVSENP